jgi:hypothetical protein
MPSDQRRDDHGERYAGKANLDRLIHELEGIVRGIALDGVVTPGEAAALARWRDTVRGLNTVAELASFAELLDVILADGVLTDDERLDLMWALKIWRTPNRYYDAITADVQRLHGVLMGLLTDGRLTDAEVQALHAWLGEHPHLQGAWPFDEIQGVVTHVLRDGAVTEDERALLQSFFLDLLPAPDHEVVHLEGVDVDTLTLKGICAVDPTLTFEGKIYAFTGIARAGQRSTLAARVASRGATVVDRVSSSLDVLVVGQKGNPNWAFCCYGRKIEEVLHLRRHHQRRILIVHENDLLDALND